MKVINIYIVESHLEFVPLYETESGWYMNYYDHAKNKHKPLLAFIPEEEAQYLINETHANN